MNLSELSKVGKGRLLRVRELKKCTEAEAIEFCIRAGWVLAEKKLGKYQAPQHKERGNNDSG